MALAYEWSEPRPESREILQRMPSMAMAEVRATQTHIGDAPPKSIDDLPPPGTRRWVIRRKAEVVAGVRAGLISIEEACKRYSLSVEEFLSWQRAIDRHGLRGLRTTRIQDYRTIDRVEPEDESPRS